jgi:murein peptide amidase A
MAARLHPFSSVTAETPEIERRSVERLLVALDQLAEQSPCFVSGAIGRFESSGHSYSLPRYVFLGPKGGGDTIRIGIFATIRGDEPEGALALAHFLTVLANEPEVAKGYALFIYPVCNPTGFEDNTTHSRSGKDLEGEFWKESAEPEIRYLQSEIWMHAFDGIVTLRSDGGSDGIYGFAAGAVLSETLLEPALREAEQFLPRTRRLKIDGFAAERGVITDGYPGTLKSVPGLRRPPFEIILETPRKAPLHRQVEAFTVALRTILGEYRYLIAIAQNI